MTSLIMVLGIIDVDERHAALDEHEHYVDDVHGDVRDDEDDGALTTELQRVAACTT